MTSAVEKLWKENQEKIEELKVKISSSNEYIKKIILNRLDQINLSDLDEQTHKDIWLVLDKMLLENNLSQIWQYILDIESIKNKYLSSKISVKKETKDKLNISIPFLKQKLIDTWDMWLRIVSNYLDKIDLSWISTDIKDKINEKLQIISEYIDEKKYYLIAPIVKEIALLVKWKDWEEEEDYWRDEVDGWESDLSNWEKNNGNSMLDKATDLYNNSINGVKWMFITEDSLKKIKEIGIDGNLSIEEFNSRLQKFINIVKKDVEFAKFSETEKINIINNLQKLWDKLKQWKENGISFLNNKFDKLAKQVEKKIWVSWWNIDFWDWAKVHFDSKDKAYEFIRKLKQNAENEFQSFWTNLVEWTWSFLLSVAKNWLWNVLALPFRINSKVSVENMYNNLREENSWWEWAFDVIISTIALFTTVNYIETIYRRVIKDSIARWQAKDISRTKVLKRITEEKMNLVIPDYSKVEGVPLNDVDFDLYNEYMRRKDAIEQLKLKRDSITNPNNKTIFEKKLKNLEDLLNINTDTFWKKAYALNIWWDTWIRNPTKLLWVFKDWWIPFKILPFWLDTSIATKAWTEFNLSEKWIQNLEKWLNYVYPKASISINNNKIDIDVKWDKGKVSENIENIRNYIKSKSKLNLDEKNSRLENLDALLDKYKSVAGYKESIISELYAIVEKWEIPIEKQKSIIQNELKSYKPWDIEFKSLWQWFGEAPWYYTKWLWFKLKEIWWNNAPKMFTSWQAWLLKLEHLADKWFLQVSEKELRDIIADIKSGIEFKKLYNKWNCLKIIPDFAKSLLFFVLRWDFIELSRIKKIREKVDEKDIWNIIEDWKKYKKSIKKWRDIIDARIQTMWNIFDIDKERFPTDKETIFESIFDEMKDRLGLNEDWKVKWIELGFTETDARRELIKMYNWYLPQFVILDVLNWNTKYSIWVEVNLDDDVKKELIAKVEKWELEFTIEDFKSVVKDLEGWLKISDLGDYKMDLLGRSEEDWVQEIKTHWEECKTKHFRSEAYGIPFDWKSVKWMKSWSLSLDKFEKYSQLANLIKIAEWEEYNWQLWELIRKINSWTDYSSDKFFSELRNALQIKDVDLIITSDTKMNDFEVRIKTLLDNKFEKLSVSNREKFLTELKNIVTDEKILWQKVKKGLLKKREVEKRKAANAIENISNLKGNIKELDNEIQKIDKLIGQSEKVEFGNSKVVEQLVELQNEFRKLWIKVDWIKITNVNWTDYQEKLNLMLEKIYIQIEELKAEKFNSLLQLNELWVDLTREQKEIITSYIKRNIFDRIEFNYRIGEIENNSENIKKFKDFRLKYLNIDSFDGIWSLDDLNKIIKNDFWISKLFSFYEILTHTKIIAKIDLNKRINIFKEFELWKSFKDLFINALKKPKI